MVGFFMDRTRIWLGGEGRTLGIWYPSKDLSIREVIRNLKES